MTFEQFLIKNNGEYVEVAGSATAQNQCVDLANAYLRDVFGQPIVEWTNAIDFPKKLKDGWEWIVNGPLNVPKPQDLMIFNMGAYGHISIFVEGNLNSFKSFDQNFPLGTPCHIQGHSYNSVKGWLHYKNAIISEMTEEQKRILDFITERKLTEGQIRQAADWLRANTVADLESKIDGLKTTISDLYKEMDEINLKYGKLLDEHNILLPKYEQMLETKENLADEKLIANLSWQKLLTLLINKIFKQ